MKTKDIKKTVKKRIKIYQADEWDIPSGGTRNGERYYRKQKPKGSGKNG